VRLGWSVGAGPLRLGGTIFRTRSRRPRGKHYTGTLPGWKCPHRHARIDLAVDCADREARRRRREAAHQRADA
jgi:hypothetical protein